MMVSRQFISFIHLFMHTAHALGEWKSISQSPCPYKAQKLVSGRQKCNYSWNKMMLALIAVDINCY